MKSITYVLGILSLCLLTMFACTKETGVNDDTFALSSTSAEVTEEGLASRYCCPGCEIEVQMMVADPENPYGGKLSIFQDDPCRSAVIEIDIYDNSAHEWITIKGNSDGNIYAVWQPLIPQLPSDLILQTFTHDCPNPFSLSQFITLTPGVPVMLGESLMCTPWSGS